MQNGQNLTILKNKMEIQQMKTTKISVDVAKLYQNKQIDTRWVQLKIKGKLLARSYFASCIQAGKVFLHGGYNQQKGILGDMYEAQFYDLPSEWIQIKSKNAKNTNPPSLRNHTLCAFTSYLILLGGQKNMLQNNNQIYRFDLRTYEWQPVKIKYVNSSKKISLALDSHIAKIHNENMYVFGGYESQTGLYHNRLLKINLKKLSNCEVQISQIQIKNGKQPCQRGNMSSCILDNQLYVFGGTNSDLIFNDFWVFNFEKQQWRQIQSPQRKELYEWPQKRKGQIMVSHSKSRSLFMFGGIKQITKQQNDIMVFLVSKNKWVRIHKNTNELYDPSPTIKKQIQSSPSIIQAKNRKNNSKSRNNSKSKPKSPFKLGIKSVTCYNNMTQSHDTDSKSISKNDYGKSLKTQYGTFNNIESPTNMKRMSVVQEKKYREFLNRKKKLLNDINKNSKISQQVKRSHSPTSQTLLYSIDTIGEQKRSPNINDDLPKVIFDEQKGALIGKKPCARDGHAGLVYQDSIIIIGGDRHMISFNDVYLFKMDKAIQNIHLYE